MPQANFITYLLNLPQDCKEIVSDDLIQFHLPRKHHDCPYCHGSHTIVDKYRPQTLRGIPGNTTYIYRNRRYRCMDCKRTFSEERPGIDRYQRMPRSVIEEIVSEHGEVVSATCIARRHGISPTTVIRHFGAYMDKQDTEIPAEASPTIFSMDEFRGNAGAMFQVAVHDLGNRICYDILKSKAKEELPKFLADIPEIIRVNAQTVSIDLSSQFRALVFEYFPNASIAADKFHADRLANEALNKIRIEEQEKKKNKDIRHIFKQSRKLLLSRPENLSQTGKKQLEELLNASPTIRTAYNLKESYFKLFDSKTRKDFSERLKAFARDVEASGLKLFKTVLKTTQEWKEEIWHGIETGYNNGFTEGCNNVIKTLKRVCFGFRNFQNFRRRILFILNNPERRERREQRRLYRKGNTKKTR